MTMKGFSDRLWTEMAVFNAKKALTEAEFPRELRSGRSR
jgi:hypothetical protein